TRAPSLHRDRGVGLTRRRRAAGWQEPESTRKCPPGPSGHPSLGRRPFPTPGHVACARLRTEQSPEALISRVAYQGFEAQTHSRRIRCRTASNPSLFEEFIIDVEGLLHTSNHAIKVWLLEPYSGYCPGKAGAAHPSPNIA